MFEKSHIIDNISLKFEFSTDNVSLMDDDIRKELESNKNIVQQITYSKNLIHALDFPLNFWGAN